MSNRLNRWLFCATVLLTACEDAAAPTERFTLELRGDGAPAFTVHREGGQHRVACTAQFTARARGRGVARWDGLDVVVYSPFDSTLATDTIEIPATDREFWARRELAAGEGDTAHIEIFAPQPFRNTLLFRYRVDGDTARHREAVPVTCGLLPDPSGGFPAITFVETRGSRSPLEPGDTVYVTYRASTAARLMSSTVRLSGAFAAESIRAERLEPLVDHTVAFVVPVGGAQDAAIHVTVGAWDALGRHLLRTRFDLLRTAPTATELQIRQ